ncbi:hypothetical protein SCUCBS95973_007327 [Sporothrix curviconia]|uniref:Uncharacterized protein n=1 Tax=Sporothrix curviconia TaxID=1260050 RepID=A0ABP0CF67_9PEZI
MNNDDHDDYDDHDDHDDQTVKALSEQKSSEHCYPRPDLISLSEYLNTKPKTSHAPASRPLPNENNDRPPDRFAIVHNVATGQSQPYEATDAGLGQFAITHRRDRAQAQAKNAHGSTILFLRGFSAASWLTTVGETYGASVELFRRHLDYPSFTSVTKTYYRSPPLPSSTVHVFQLSIPTICVLNGGSADPGQPEDLQRQRRRNAEDMTRYFIELRSNAQTGDSVVRHFHLLSNEEYVLEQTVTVQVRASGPASGSAGNAIVWLDSGRDLAHGERGPWTPPPGTPLWKNYFLPVIVDHAHAEDVAAADGDGGHLGAGSSGADLSPGLGAPGASRRSSFSVVVGDGQRAAGGGADVPWMANQNSCALPLQYGAGLDRALASRDTLYALSELFQFSAAATAQLLNFVHAKIKHELSFIGTAAGGGGHASAVSLLNLNFIKDLLDARTQGLVEVVGILRNRDALMWPRVPDGEPGADTARQTAALLLADFEHLLQRAEALAAACDQGVLTLANSAALEETRRSTELSLVVQRLTIIGTVFIPLSFVCSLWGMNFQEMGTGSLHLYWWPVSAVPFVLASYVIYRWETVASVWGRFVRWWSTRHTARRRFNGTGEVT